MDVTCLRFLPFLHSTGLRLVQAALLANASVNKNEKATNLEAAKRIFENGDRNGAPYSNKPNEEFLTYDTGKYFWCVVCYICYVVTIREVIGCGSVIPLTPPIIHAHHSLSPFLFTHRCAERGGLGEAGREGQPAAEEGILGSLQQHHSQQQQ